MGCGKSAPVHPAPIEKTGSPAAAGKANKDETNETNEAPGQQKMNAADGKGKKAAKKKAKAKSKGSKKDEDDSDIVEESNEVAEHTAEQVMELWQSTLPYPIRHPEHRPLVFIRARKDKKGTRTDTVYKVEVIKAVRGSCRWHRTLASLECNLDALELDTGVCRQAIKLLNKDVSVVHAEWMPAAKFTCDELPKEKTPADREPAPLRSPENQKLVFDVKRREQFQKKDEPVYSVAMTWAVKGVCHLHRTRMSIPDALDALAMDTGVVRKELRSLRPPEVSTRVEWMPWHKFHPDGQPCVRGSVAVYNVPWHASMQIGILDPALYTNAEPAAAMLASPGAKSNAEPAASSRARKDALATPLRTVPQKEMMSLISKRGKAFGMGDLRVSLSPDGGCVCEANASEVLPDPFAASQEQLAEFLGPLLQENPDEEEACEAMARWKFALQQRKEYVNKLARPGYWQDLPFYSVVVPVFRQRAGYADGPPPTMPKQPTIKEVDADLPRLSAALGENCDLDALAEAEEERIAYVKSIKWSVDMPLRRWRVDIRPGPQPFRWEEFNPIDLREPLHNGSEAPFEHSEEGYFAEVEDRTLAADLADYEAWANSLRLNASASSCEHHGEWDEAFIEAACLSGGVVGNAPTENASGEAAWGEVATAADYEAWEASLHICGPPEGSMSEAPAWDELWWKAGLAWFPLPDEIIKKEEGEPRNVVLPSPEELQHIRDRKCLPEGWCFELLVAEDYSREVALAQLQQRRESERKLEAEQYEALVAQGEKLAMYPEKRRWPQVEVSEAMLAVIRRLQALDQQRKVKEKPVLRPAA